MVDFYNIIDAVLIAAIIYFSYRSYQNKIYVQIFEYFKIFVAITLSAKLSSYTAIILQKMYITKADTYTTLILIAFAINLAFFYYTGKYIIRFLNKNVTNINFRKYSAILITIIEVIILTTFSIYIVMQLYISKVYISKTLDKTLLYPRIEKFYKSFLNDEFVKMVMSSDTGTNREEIIFKSFKNSL
jgi:hypothetical protein